jgi:hypothetical protein
MKKLAILEEELAELGVILNRGGGVRLGGNLDRVRVHLAATARSTAHEPMRAETYYTYTQFSCVLRCNSWKYGLRGYTTTYSKHAMPGLRKQ